MGRTCPPAPVSFPLLAPLQGQANWRSLPPWSEKDEMEPRPGPNTSGSGERPGVLVFAMPSDSFPPLPARRPGVRAQAAQSLLGGGGPEHPRGMLRTVPSPPPVVGHGVG